jgi:hypothetical protein
MGKLENLKPFKKGHDPRRHVTGPYKVPDLADLIVEEVGEEGLREAMKKLRSLAIKGNLKAIQELLDRTYGKAPQKLEHEGEVNLNVNDARNALLAKLSKEQE